MRDFEECHEEGEPTFYESVLAEDYDVSVDFGYNFILTIDGSAPISMAWSVRDNMYAPYGWDADGGTTPDIAIYYDSDSGNTLMDTTQPGTLHELGFYYAIDPPSLLWAEVGNNADDGGGGTPK